jgi:predicted nucleic acid-binding protein
MILVDSSVWIAHLRKGDVRLASMLEGGEVLMHPFILGELACGNLGNRAAVLSLLENLPEAPVATDAEALAFIHRHALMGKGIGYIDVHLLAAIALAGQATLWTLDKRLAAVGETLGFAYISA